MPTIEKSDLYDMLPLLTFFIWVFVITPLLPIEIQGVAGPMGMGVCIIAMIVINEALKWMAAEYTHIKAYCRPSGLQLDLFVRDIESVEIEPGIYATKLELGQKVKHPFYQEMERCVLKHYGAWEERMEFEQGKAKYKGQEVPHPKSATVVLYEPYSGSFDIDHLSPIPVFWLVEAPRDYYNPRMLVHAVSGNPGLSKAELFEINKLKEELEKVRAEAIEWKRQALYWHNQSVRQGEVIDHLKNEVEALIDSKSDMKQAVVEQVTTLLEAHVNLKEALKELRGPLHWFTPKLLIPILGLVALILFIYNPTPIMKWLSVPTNQFFVIILAAIILLLTYYSRRRG